MPRERDEYGHATMSFGDHLEDLRRRVLLALLAPIPLSVLTFLYSVELIEILLRPLYRVLEYNDLPRQVQVLSPPEFIVTQIKLSIIFALVLSAPWIVYQIWRFIGPGLYRHERRFVYFLLPGSAILTAAGVLLLYFAMLPLMLQVLVMFGASMREPELVLTPGERLPAPAELERMPSTLDVRTEPPESPVHGQMWLQMPQRTLHVAVERSAPGSDPGRRGGIEVLRVPLGPPSAVAQQFRLSEYISFVLLLLLGIVIAFQLPLVIVLLGWVGLTSTEWLRRNRKYALMLCAVVSAIITPADAVSMIAMLIPLYALYELGILLLVIAPARRVAEGEILRRPQEEKSPDRGNNP